MRRWRLGLATAGILLGLFGIFRLLTQIPGTDLVVLACWLVGALVVHDGILSPAVAGIGWAISRVVPPRARRYVQAGLIVGALITIVAVPMIYREGSQPKSKAILQQNYGGNLTLLLGVVAALTLVGYAVKVARDSRQAHPASAPDAASDPES
jgi:hypothetical protein